MKPVVIGIDPGSSGAIAIKYPDQPAVVFPWIGESEFKRVIDEIEIYCAVEKCGVIAYVEEVGGFVGVNQPGSTMFNFGRNFGVILGVLLKAEFPTVLVRPQKWQKGLPTTPKLADKALAKRKHKNDLKEVAARLFPHLRVTLKNADALLILDYGITQEKGR